MVEQRFWTLHYDSNFSFTNMSTFYILVVFLVHRFFSAVKLTIQKNLVYVNHKNKDKKTRNKQKDLHLIEI